MAGQVYQLYLRAELSTHGLSASPLSFVSLDVLLREDWCAFILKK